MSEYLNLPKTKKVGKKTIPYMSYSQYSSYNETSMEFKYQMILGYIFGQWLPSRFETYSEFGKHCGEYIESKGKKRGNMLNDSDCEILDGFMKDFDPKSQYERKIWVDRGNYFILGFEDRWSEVSKKACIVQDFKTGSKDKESKYSSEKYGQTTLYSHAESLKGYTDIESHVTLLVREGNPMAAEPTELHLTGEIIHIPTPYSKERAEELFADMDRTAEKIALLNTTYQKLKELKITL